MKNVGLLNAVIYTGASVVMAGLFVFGTLWGRYTLVERIGGAAWVFSLSMIILMPLITQAVKKRLNGS